MSQRPLIVGFTPQKFTLLHNKRFMGKNASIIPFSVVVIDGLFLLKV